MFDEEGGDTTGKEKEAAALFPKSPWTIIFEAKGGNREALGAFLEQYRRPLYVLAVRKGLSSHDAEDAVADFIFSFCEPSKSRLQHVDKPVDGQMRIRLTGWFSNFLTDQWRKKTAAKRGGNLIHALYNDPAIEQVLGDGKLTAGEALDAVWALQWFERSKKRFMEESEEHPEILARLFEEENSQKTLQNLADEHGFTFSQLRHRLSSLRTRFQSMLREELAPTVSDPSLIDIEMKNLSQALRAMYRENQS